MRDALDSYRFNEAASELYAFTWHELCDWYLELAKGTLYNDASPEAQQGARHTLLTVLLALVRLMHPIMPFLTEEIWQRLSPWRGSDTTASVSLAPYPSASDFPDDPASLLEVAALQETIVAVRRIRAEMQLSPRAPLAMRGAEVALLIKHAQALKDLAGIEDVAVGGREGICATAVVQGQPLYLPLEGVIDVDAERARLDGQIDRSLKDVGALEKRLGNTSYVANAPAHIVQESRDKLAAAQERLAQLQAARKDLE